jgi:hypothetical protein
LVLISAVVEAVTDGSENAASIDVPLLPALCIDKEGVKHPPLFGTCFKTNAESVPT